MSQANTSSGEGAGVGHPAVASALAAAAQSWSAAPQMGLPVPRSRTSRLLLVSILWCLTGCGALTPPQKDAGPERDAGGDVDAGEGGGNGGGGEGTPGGGGGAGGGAGDTGGGAGGTGGGAGGTGGGAGGTGGGAGGTGGGAGILVVASVGLLDAGTAAIVGLSGGASDLWALDSDGLLFHSSGAAFARTAQLDAKAKGVYASNGAVFVVTATSLRTCVGDCAADGGFGRFALPASDTGAGVCGVSSAAVWATADDGAGQTSLYRWNGMAWGVEQTRLPLASPHGCSAMPDGVVFIAGQDGVLRFEQGAGTFEAIDAGSTTFEAVFGIDTEVQAVGGRFRVGRRLPNGTWEVLDNPLAPGSLHAIHGASPAFLVKGGDPFSALRPNWAVWDGGVWDESLGMLNGMGAVRAINAVSGRRVYLGGQAPSGGPSIVRATW